MLQKNRGECEILERRKSSKRKDFEFPRGHSYDRRFVAYYENLFGQIIKVENCGTGEYDDIMQSI